MAAPKASRPKKLGDCTPEEFMRHLEKNLGYVIDKRVDKAISDQFDAIVHAAAAKLRNDVFAAAGHHDREQRVASHVLNENLYEAKEPHSTKVSHDRIVGADRPIGATLMDRLSSCASSADQIRRLSQMVLARISQNVEVAGPVPGAPPPPAHIQHAIETIGIDQLDAIGSLQRVLDLL